MNEDFGDFVVDEWNCEEESSREEHFSSPRHNKRNRTDSRHRKRSPYGRQSSHRDSLPDRRSRRSPRKSSPIRHRQKRSTEERHNDHKLPRDLRHRIKSRSDEFKDKQERYSPELSEIYHSRHSPEYQDQLSPKEEFLYDRCNNDTLPDYQDISPVNRPHYQNISDDEADVGRSNRMVVGMHHHREAEGFKIAVINTRENSYRDSDNFEISVHNDRLDKCERILISGSESEGEEERRETRHRELEVLPEYIESLQQDEDQRQPYGHKQYDPMFGMQPPAMLGSKTALYTPQGPNVQSVFDQCVHCKYPFDPQFLLNKPNCEMCHKPKVGDPFQAQTAQIIPQSYLSIVPQHQPRPLPLPPPTMHSPHPAPPKPLLYQQPIPSIPADYNPHPNWKPPPQLPVHEMIKDQPPPRHPYQGSKPGKSNTQPPKVKESSHPHPEHPPWPYPPAPLMQQISPPPPPPDLHPWASSQSFPTPSQGPLPFPLTIEEISSAAVQSSQEKWESKNKCGPRKEPRIPSIPEPPHNVPVSASDSQSFDFPPVASASISRGPVRYGGAAKSKAKGQTISLNNAVNNLDYKPIPFTVERPNITVQRPPLQQKAAPLSPTSLMKTLQRPWC